MSIKGKLETIAKTGFKPITAGIKNKIITNKEVERKAAQRAQICFGCEHMELEPVGFMQVEDDKIPEVSKMMCEDCFCSIPLKIRQDKILCKKWV